MPALTELEKMKKALSLGVLGDRQIRNWPLEEGGYIKAAACFFFGSRLSGK